MNRLRRNCPEQSAFFDRVLGRISDTFTHMVEKDNCICKVAEHYGTNEDFKIIKNERNGDKNGKPTMVRKGGIL